MQYLLQLTFIALQIFIVPWPAATEIPEPYCYKNITETSYKVVTKTRLKTVSSKNFFKKLSFKKDTQVEIYEDHEPVFKIKVERTCCEGYKMTDLDLCEPECVENGCPQHSKCVEPEVCECETGYFSTRSALDGKHYCEPICEKPCPENSACVAPNECACQKGYHVAKGSLCMPFCASGCPYGGECIAPNMCTCQKGYKSEKGSCLSICSQGDKCQNGVCILRDVCMCNRGFKKNYITQMCEPGVDNDMLSTTYYPETTETQQSSDSSMEVETDIETSNDNIDPNQVFDEDIELTTFYATEDYDSSSSAPLEVHHQCPNDFIFHKGQCRPLKFVSNEIDCWLKPCQDKNAVCLKNGTCACKEGLKMFRTHVVDHNTLNHTLKAVCLSEVDYEARLQNLDENPGKSAVQEPTNGAYLFFVVLGVLIMVCALVFLGVKLFYKHTGEVDVEGKTLACAYDNRACIEAEKSNI